MVPLETKLIDFELLTAEELAWLDAYHTKVRGCVDGGLESIQGRGNPKMAGARARDGAVRF